MIKLEDFVSETLDQIVRGIVSAQNSTKDIGGVIAPADVEFRTDQGLILYDPKDKGLIEKVEFSVEVTASEGTATSGGLGILVGVLTAGSKGESSSKNQSVSNIQFSVPVKYPTQKKENS